MEKILTGLGFSDGDMVRSPHDFSGGFQVRLNLAKVLVSEPDLLLLDEPTNYLDITSIRWIENFLLSWPHELMLITHDRGFMDKLATHTVGIHRKKARKIEGNTEKYYDRIAQDEEIYEKTRLNDERRAKEIRLFITRFRAKARLANMVQSRVKTLAKMEKKDKLEQAKNLEFSFRSKPFKAKQVFTVEDFKRAKAALVNDGVPEVSPGMHAAIIDNAICQQLESDPYFRECIMRGYKISEAFGGAKTVDMYGLHFIIQDDPYRCKLASAGGALATRSDTGDVHVAHVLGKGAFGYVDLNDEKTMKRLMGGAGFKVQDISKTGVELTIGYNVPFQAGVIDRAYGLNIAGCTNYDMTVSSFA